MFREYGYMYCISRKKDYLRRNTFFFSEYCISQTSDILIWSVKWQQWVLITFIWFGGNEINNRFTRGATEDNPKIRNGFTDRDPLTFFPLHFFCMFFWVILLLARLSVTTGVMRWYLDPCMGCTRGPTPSCQYMSLPEGLLVTEQSQEHRGESWIQAVTLGKLDRAVEG